MKILTTGKPNLVLRAVIDQLKDPNNWNGKGGYVPGKACLITSCFWRSLDMGFINGQDGIAMAAIDIAIEKNFGLGRGSYVVNGVKKSDVIKFNDHPDTTHEHIMKVLYEAEEATRPFWRDRLEFRDPV